jgi:hypothetical protein
MPVTVTMTVDVLVMHSTVVVVTVQGTYSPSLSVDVTYEDVMVFVGIVLEVSCV